MASVRSSSSHYDSITAEDLFDSFMNVALSNEKEICPKNDVISDCGYSNCSDQMPLSNNLYQDSIYASCDEIFPTKTSNIDNKKEKLFNINFDSKPTTSYVDELSGNKQILTYAVVNNPKTIAEESFIGEYSVSQSTKSSENSFTDSSPIELYAKPNKSMHTACSPKLNRDSKVDISFDSEDKYDTVGSILRSNEVNGFNVQQKTNFHDDYKMKVEDVAFNKRLFTAECNDLYKSCLETIENRNKASLNKETPKAKKPFFKFQKATSKEKLYKDLSKYSSHTIPKTDNDDIQVLCDGYLFKQGGTGMTPKNWRLRWFELKKNNCLYYYKSQQDRVPSGAVILFNYAITRAPEVTKRFAFQVAKGGARSYFLAANSEDEMKKWMKFITESSHQPLSELSTIPECSLKNVSIPALSIQEPDCHGFLWKRGSSHKSWRKRYCVMKYGCLFYYENIADQVALGVFKLHNYVIDHSNDTKNGFQANPPYQKLRTYYFYTESEIDLERWIGAIKLSIATVK